VSSEGREPWKLDLVDCGACGETIVDKTYWACPVCEDEQRCNQCGPLCVSAGHKMVIMATTLDIPAGYGPDDPMPHDARRKRHTAASLSGSSIPEDRPANMASTRRKGKSALREPVEDVEVGTLAQELRRLTLIVTHANRANGEAYAIIDDGLAKMWERFDAMEGKVVREVGALKGRVTDVQRYVDRRMATLDEQVQALRGLREGGQGTGAQAQVGTSATTTLVAAAPGLAPVDGARRKKGGR
jgi:hypothetical protein